MLDIKCGWATFMANHPYFFFSFISLCHLVYQIFVALFVLSLCPFDISVGIGAFVMGLGQISSVLSHNTILSMHNTHKTMTMVPFGGR